MQLLEKGGSLSAGRSRVAVTRPPGLRENHIDRHIQKKRRPFGTPSFFSLGDLLLDFKGIWRHFFLTF
jgi:hypothetical protein